MTPSSVNHRACILFGFLIALCVALVISAEPTCMNEQDYRAHPWAFESPFGVTATNTCITYYGTCHPSSKQNTDCGCTCVCPDGRGGFFCNETLTDVKNTFGFARALQRRFWTSSLKVNGSLHDAYKLKYNATERMDGWTIEFWLRAYSSSFRVTAGTVLFEFRGPVTPCSDPGRCKNGDDPNFPGSNGYVWSLIGYYGPGAFNLYAEIRSNAPYAVNGHDYKRIASKVAVLDVSVPQHISLTMSRERAAIFRSGFSSDEFLGNATVLRLLRNTVPLLQVVIPYDTDFETRPLYIGPWDVMRGRFARDGRETTEEPLYYRRGNEYAEATGTPLNILQRSCVNSFYDALVMDEFRFWTRALSEDEIAEIASKPVVGNETDLMVYWDFNDATGLVERNKASKFADMLHGVHVVDDVKVTGDDEFLAPNETYVYDPRTAPLGPQPFWVPARGGSPELPESLYPAFVSSFINTSPRPSERSPFGVYEHGYGNLQKSFQPPRSLAYHAAIGHGDLLYIFGGDQSADIILADFVNFITRYRPSQKIWIYNTVTRMWQPPVDLSSQLSWTQQSMTYHAAAVVDSTVYFIGILEARPVVISLNTETRATQVFAKDEWISAVLAFGAGHRCDTVERTIYCFGGGQAATLSFSVFPTLTILDTDTMTMTFESPSIGDAWPSARMSHYVLAYRWRSTPGIVVFGGGAAWQEPFSPSTDAWFYNITSSTWQPFATKVDPTTLLHFPAYVSDSKNRRVISIGGVPYRDVIEELARNGSSAPLDTIPKWTPFTPTARVYYINEKEAEPFVDMAPLTPDATSTLWIPENQQFFAGAAGFFSRGQSYEVFAIGGISLLNQAGTQNYIPSPIPKLVRISAGCQSFLGINPATGLCQPCSQTYRSQPVPGEGGCTLCPGGLMSSGSGTPCEPCPSGQFRPGSDPSILMCQACPSGQQPNQARDACISIVGSNNANFAYIVIPLVPLTAAAIWLLVRYGRQKQEERRVAKILGDTIDEKQYNFSFLSYDELEVGDELGSGSFGSVYKGIYKGRTVAIKVSKPGAVEGVREFLREAEVMMTLKPHPNVLQLVGVCTHGGSALVVLEFVGGGSLDKVLHKSGVPQEDLKRVIYQICSGLKHLHEHNLIHRDLACRNILVERDDMGRIVPKIADFGMSRVVEAENKRGKTQTQFGPVPWMAPESIGELKYSTESDMWSLGITIWELVTRQDPSKQMPLVDLAIAIRDSGFHPKVPAWAPDWLRTIFDGCWRKKAEERMSLEDVMSALGMSSDEIELPPMRRKSPSISNLGYATIDSSSPKGAKKDKKKVKAKETPKKSDDLVALLATAREELRTTEKRLHDALLRDNELREQLGYEKREISRSAMKILDPNGDHDISKRPRRKSTGAVGSSNTALLKREPE